jgi:glutamate synthase (NADPH/NADH) small chain
MGKITGFLEHRRAEPGHRPPAERVNDFNDVTVPLSPEEVRVQAARCMDCGVPFCHSLGCPLANYIPDWNDLVYRGRMEEALRCLEATNPLPEVTGRICPALCEMSCTLAINDSPVSIKAIELEIIEHGFARGWVRPIRPVRERGVEVAVIGSGPAGLAAAMRLREHGYAVTVYEKDALPGGILRYGIPNFKLEKHVLDRRIALLRESGITFVCGVRIGEDISVRYLRSQFPAMVIAAGAGTPRDVPVPGRELQGIHFAMEYLGMATEVVCGLLTADRCISAHGKRVLVIGGGDTGADCVGTANRQGAVAVHQYEIMPRPPEWTEPRNPRWPEWPVVLRTSTSHEEGVERDWAVATKQFIGENGRVTAAEFVRVAWERDPATGKMSMRELPETHFRLPVDLVLLATGFVHVEHGRFVTDLQLKLNPAGNIAVDAASMTSVPGVFAAGDAVAGASLVVRALSQGVRAAAGVHAYLNRSSGAATRP